MLETSNGVKCVSLVSETSKIEDKLRDFRSIVISAFSSAEKHLETLGPLLTDADLVSDDMKTELNNCVASIKSCVSDLVKVHREVHQPVSKFGKFIDRNLAEDTSHLTSYFIDRTDKDRIKSRVLVDSALQSPFLKERDTTFASEDLIRLVVIEHLLRQGLDALATNLAQEFGLTTDEVGLDKFRELSNLVSTIQRGELDCAKSWLSAHEASLGSKANQLQYCLAKLGFLTAVRQQSHNPAAILHFARQLVPFAQIYAADFEHLMGSLVFLGRSLEGTPYADLAFDPCGAEPMNISDDCTEQCEFESKTNLNEEMTSAQTHTSSGNALTEAANLFRICCCHQLNLSDVDPLCVIFNSGCRLLSRQQHLQRALSCFTKYTPVDGDTLPIAVELDPVAHRHNIFHCPVIKEVIATSNCPVRLSCGHVISRDAFESLPSSDRSKVKCPYCPVETYKNQALDLIF